MLSSPDSELVSDSNGIQLAVLIFVFALLVLFLADMKHFSIKQSNKERLRQLLNQQARDRAGRKVRKGVGIGKYQY
jgi:Na+/melibiose symporter-like transporter